MPLTGTAIASVSCRSLRALAMRSICRITRRIAARGINICAAWRRRAGAYVTPASAASSVKNISVWRAASTRCNQRIMRALLRRKRHQQAAAACGISGAAAITENSDAKKAGISGAQRIARSRMKKKKHSSRIVTMAAGSSEKISVAAQRHRAVCALQAKMAWRHRRVAKRRKTVSWRSGSIGMAAWQQAAAIVKYRQA